MGHGNWNSEKVMRNHYIHQSSVFRRNNAEMILGESISDEEGEKEGKGKKRKRENTCESEDHCNIKKFQKDDEDDDKEGSGSGVKVTVVCSRPQSFVFTLG
jgi:hypothetical protein